MANRQLEANKNVRDLMANLHITQWQLADALNISEVHLCRKLRHELPDDEKARMMSAIEQIREGET